MQMGFWIRYPISAQEAPGLFIGLQNNSYLFDLVGNLTQRQDGNLGVTENVFPDHLNRLDHTVGDTNTQMTYDAMGRIASWEATRATVNVTDYTTPQSGCTYYANSQTHAVRRNTQGAWAQSFCYDANGNMTSTSINGTPNYSVAWTSFNQPSDLVTIEAGISPAGTQFMAFSALLSGGMRNTDLPAFFGPLMT